MIRLKSKFVREDGWFSVSENCSGPGGATHVIRSPILILEEVDSFPHAKSQCSAGNWENLRAEMLKAPAVTAIIQRINANCYHRR